MKPMLLCMRGLPGSGKSTIARSYLGILSDVVRVNRDDLRKSLFDGEGILENWKEMTITRVQQETARAALKAGKAVIVDDMNLRNKYLREWNKIANECGATFHIQDVLTPVDVCVQRDSARERSVGEDVIRDLAQRFYKNGEFPKYEPLTESDVRKPADPFDGDLHDAVLVDIDGTVAKMNGRSPYDWARVGEDLPNVPIINLVNSIRHGSPYDEVIFLSGRDGSCREETLAWLQKHLGWSESRFTLFMRAPGDQRRDDIVKYEIYDREIRGKYNVSYILDDRDQVVKMWREIGLTCLQVDYGNF